MSSNRKGVFGILAALCLPLLLSGCVLMISATPHQAFVESYGWYVGKPLNEFIEDAGKRAFYNTKKIILEGGFVEFMWGLANRQCKIFYTYNPQTKIIVSWRYEGTNNQCAINPYT